MDSEDSLLIVPSLLSDPEMDEIVQFFIRNIPRDQIRQTNHFDFPRPDKPTLLVKYGDSDLLNEASTQTFFHALAQRDVSDAAPRIPAVYHVFWGSSGAEHCFFVMEKIDMPTLTECKTISADYAEERAAAAVKWLFDQMPFVPSTVFGRISVNRKAGLWHQFFPDHYLQVPFAGPDGFAKLISRALSRRPGGSKKPLPVINLPGDERVIYHSNIRKDNFLLDVATGRICVINFLHIGVLPKSFQEYAFFNIGDRFAAAVGRRLGYTPPALEREMTGAAVILVQCGDSTLELDEFGDRRPVDRYWVK